MKQYVKVQHKQVYGRDIIHVYGPDGDAHSIGDHPVAKGLTPIESAASAMTAGFLHVCELIDSGEFSKDVHVAMSSTMPGALDKYSADAAAFGCAGTREKMPE